MTEKEWKEAEKKWNSIFHNRTEEDKTFNMLFTLFMEETEKIMDKCQDNKRS